MKDWVKKIINCKLSDWRNTPGKKIALTHKLLTTI